MKRWMFVLWIVCLFMLLWIACVHADTDIRLNGYYAVERAGSMGGKWKIGVTDYMYYFQHGYRNGGARLIIENTETEDIYIIPLEQYKRKKIKEIIKDEAINNTGFTNYDSKQLGIR